MVDMRNNLSRQVEAEVRGHFGDKVYRTRIPRNIRLSEAPSHGKPILLYDIHSRGAVTYLKLAEEILERISAETAVSNPPPASRTPEPSTAVHAEPTDENTSQHPNERGSENE
jgi:hypothetical protein